MTQATYTVTPSSSINKIWRKIQTPLQEGAQFMSEEWESIGDLKEFDVDWSTREILFPVDLNSDAGVASIGEGAAEARPMSPNAEEGSVSPILFNKRFTISKTAKWIDQRSRAAMVERQIRWSGMKALQAVGRRFSEYFWGFSTGYMAQTSTNATQASGTYTIANAYGVSGLGPTTNSFNVANFFEVGDSVALVRSGALVTNAIGVITAISTTTPSLDITWAGSVDSDADDYIVFANSLENTTLSGGTDYNRGLIGILDQMTTASICGISSSSVPKWAPGYSSTAAGRFTGIKYRKMRQGADNKGGGKIDTLWWSNGVENDVVDQYEAAVRFNDPFGMEIDGTVKTKGVSIKTSRKVPNGYVFGWDAKKSVKKITLLPKPSGTPVWEDGDKLENSSGFIFSMDFPVGLLTTNRGNMAYLSNQTEQ